MVGDGGGGPVEEMVDGAGGDGACPSYDDVGAASRSAPDLREHDAREDAGVVAEVAGAERPARGGGTL